MKPETLRKIIDIDSRMIDFFKEFQYSYLNFDYENLLKLIFVLENKPMKSISLFCKEDADFAITNQKRINSILNSVRIFLMDSKLLGYYHFSDRSVYPLICIVYHQFYKEISYWEFENFWDKNQDEFISFKIWLYRFLLFNKSSNKKVVDPPIEELLHVFSAYPEELKLTVETLDNCNTDFVLYLLTDKYFDKDYIGHCMSPFVLKPHSYSPKYINDIRNIDIVSDPSILPLKEVLSFEDWINHHVIDKSFYIKKSLIPENEELWTEEKFSEFCEARGKLIVEKINQIFSELATETPSN